MNIRRRDFIRWLAVWLTGAALPVRGFAAHKTAPTPASIRDWLKCVDDGTGALLLGAACLRDCAVEQSLAALEAKLEASLGPPPRSVNQARRRLGAVVEREFSDRDWLQVEGWWLSRTEARLYALASLSH